MSDNHNTEKMLLAVLAGAAAGIAIGLLMAPDKGSETRKKLHDLAGDLVGKLKDEFSGHKESHESSAND